MSSSTRLTVLVIESLSLEAMRTGLLDLVSSQIIMSSLLENYKVKIVFRVFLGLRSTCSFSSDTPGKGKVDGSNANDPSNFHLSH